MHEQVSSNCFICLIYLAHVGIVLYMGTTPEKKRFIHGLVIRVIRSQNCFPMDTVNGLSLRRNLVHASGNVGFYKLG